MIDVVPVSDIAGHVQGSTCKCVPKLEMLDNGEMLFVHSSFDGRELSENEIEYPGWVVV